MGSSDPLPQLDTIFLVFGISPSHISLGSEKSAAFLDVDVHIL